MRFSHCRSGSFPLPQKPHMNQLSIFMHIPRVRIPGAWQPNLWKKQAFRACAALQVYTFGRSGLEVEQRFPSLSPQCPFVPSLLCQLKSWPQPAFRHTIMLGLGADTGRVRHSGPWAVANKKGIAMSGSYVHGFLGHSSDCNC